MRVVVALLTLFYLGGCAASDLTVKRQSEAESKIEYLIQSAKKNEQRSNDLASQLQIYEEQLRSSLLQLKQLQESNREQRAVQEELAARMALLSRQGGTPRVEVVNPAPSQKSSRESGPPPEYLKAFGIYSANNFAEAITAFTAFITHNPQSDYAANALYWIGECHYTLSDLPKARDAFLKVSGAYPTSPKAPDAMLKLGYTLTALKEKEKARGIFESLITAYPSSSAAAKARERLSAN
ncbi:MAG TPA: tol-pal system protein YbgF [Desulfuromonadales bacterium]|nr:tol-pal system protein YbgF [Desulfuromonadales bacterium]